MKSLIGFSILSLNSDLRWYLKAWSLCRFFLSAHWSKSAHGQGHTSHLWVLDWVFWAVCVWCWAALSVFWTSFLSFYRSFPFGLSVFSRNGCGKVRLDGNGACPSVLNHWTIAIQPGRSNSCAKMIKIAWHHKIQKSNQKKKPYRERNFWQVPLHHGDG